MLSVMLMQSVMIARLLRKIIQVFNRECHVPVFAPYYIAVLNGELLKVFGFKVRVVLRVWMALLG